MLTLSTLENTHRPKKNRKRVGRGVGSGTGKTCGRGHKGDKSRSGYKRRYGNEGGQKPLYKKLPTRGFCNERFRLRYFAISLGLIEKLYEEGELVSLSTLADKGIHVERDAKGLKVLANGELTKKVSIEAHAFSAAALEKLGNLKISYSIVEGSSKESFKGPSKESSNALRGS